MDNMSIARPYANAVFATAMAANAVDLWSNVLTLLATSVQDTAMKRFIHDPTVSDESVVKCLVDIASQALGAELNDQVIKTATELLLLMQRGGRLKLLPALLIFYNQLLAEHAGMRNAEVITAMELGEKDQQQLKDKLEQHFKSKLRVNFVVDPSVLGGVMISCGSDVVDGTVQGRLKRLKEDLVQGGTINDSATKTL